MHRILTSSPHNEYPQIRGTKNPKLQPNRKIFHYQHDFNWLKENCRTFPTT